MHSVAENMETQGETKAGKTQEIVLLGQLKAVLNGLPTINGMGIVKIARYDLNWQVLVESHASSELRPDGRIIMLYLDNAPTNARAAAQLVSESAGLVVALDIKGYQRLVRKLSLLPQSGIQAKLYDSMGEPTLWFDQVDLLRDLHASSADWWIDHHLKKAKTYADVAKIRKRLVESNLEQPFYQLYFGVNVGLESTGPIVCAQAQLRRWLPRLPADLGLLVKPIQSRYLVFELQDFGNHSAANLFALFGSGETYLQALQRAKQ